MTSEECLQSRCEQLGVRYIYLSYSNFTTSCRTCLVPTSAMKNAQKKGCPMSPAGFFNMETEDCYYSLFPDPASFVQLPWDKQLAWVQCNVSHNGQEYSKCPRRSLIRQVQEAAKAGLSFKAGIEPEFIITTKDGSSLSDPIDATNPWPLHEPGGISRNFPLLTEIFECMKELGWNPYQIFHEASNCQFEINFDYSDVITAADRHCFFKFMTKRLAEKHGVRITFMPVPFPNLLCGTGMHINLSAWDKKGERNLHLGGGGNEEISATTRHFVGGLLKHARACTGLLCSSVNSYKRLNNGSWCPNTISWGGNDKSVLVRVPTKDRIEHRLSDSSTNLHLTLAALVACGIEGITNKIEPPKDSFGKERVQGRERSIPLALNEALQELEESGFLRGVFGDQMVEDYVCIKRKEWFKYSQQITQWEIDYYMNC